MKILAFFNNKGGVGKTSLAYHLAWMFSELGLTVVAADLDPQANLTSMFLPEERLEELWPDGKHPRTIQGVVEPILKGIGDIADPWLERIDDRIYLLAGDLALSSFEDRLSSSWPECHNRNEAAFRVMSAFYRAAQRAADRVSAHLVLIDVGPNLGAINRSALIASNFVVIPLASDLFSLQGLRNLGPRLGEWRQAWSELKAKNPAPDLDLPPGEIQPIGYVVLQHAVRVDRPVKAYLRWVERIPAEYRRSVLQTGESGTNQVLEDTNCLALLKHYRSLVPLAMEARKPMFFLRPADGAIGSHVDAVKDCYKDFEGLARRILERCGVDVSATSLFR